MAWLMVDAACSTAAPKLGFLGSWPAACGTWHVTAYVTRTGRPLLRGRTGTVWRGGRPPGAVSAARPAPSSPLCGRLSCRLRCHHHHHQTLCSPQLSPTMDEHYGMRLAFFAQPSSALCSMLISLSAGQTQLSSVPA